MAARSQPQLDPGLLSNVSNHRKEGERGCQFAGPHISRKGEKDYKFIAIHFFSGINNPRGSNHFTM